MTIDFVPTSHPLSRPQCANVALKNATSEWIGFLDDDDVLYPDHSDRLIACALSSGTKMAYGSVLVRQAGKTSVFGVDGHHADFVGQNRCMSMAVFHRSLLETCAFDDEFVLLEDWDFWIQAARVTQFAFAGPEPTCECTGNQSGTWNEGTSLPYIERLRRKWSKELNEWSQDLKGILEAAQRNIGYARTSAGTLVRFALRAGVEAEFVLERAKDHWLVMNAWNMRGVACELLGKFSEAAFSYSEALRLNPASTQMLSARDRAIRKLQGQSK